MHPLLTSPSLLCLTPLQSELVRKLCGAPFLGESSPTLGIASQVDSTQLLLAAVWFPPSLYFVLLQECIVKISGGSRAAIRLWDTSASGCIT